VIRQEGEVAACLCKWSDKCCGRGHNGHSLTSNTFVKNIDEVMRAGRLVSLKLLKLAFLTRLCLGAFVDVSAVVKLNYFHRYEGDNFVA
jgi:hypothetical protein